MSVSAVAAVPFPLPSSEHKRPVKPKINSETPGVITAAPKSGREYRPNKCHDETMPKQTRVIK